MEMRSDELEVAPIFPRHALPRALLIQNLAESIKQTFASIAPQKVIAQRNIQDVAGPCLQPCTFGQNLLPAGVFCPWCTARIPCAFHLPEDGCIAACKPKPPRTEGILSSCHYSEDNPRIFFPPPGLAPPDAPPSVREQGMAQKENVNLHCTKRTNEKLHGEGKLSPSQWLNNAALDMNSVDDENVSTDLNCSEACYAESETSDSSVATDNSPKLHERSQERSIVWARGSNWGIATRKHGSC